MFRFLARLVGLFAIAGAVIALVVDGTRSIAASALILTPLGQAWFSFDPASLEAAQAWIGSHVEAHLGGWVWDPVIGFVLSLPVWLVFGALGALLILVGTPARLRAASA